MQTIRVDLSQPLLNADDVAALLCVPRSSVYEYARRLHDPLPSVSIGRHRRFIREDIEAWLERHRAVPIRTPPTANERPPTKVSSNQARRRRRRRH
jgi:excisionase family DNA binding protein